MNAIMTSRVIGYDVARFLAIVGMVIVNFKHTLGKDGSAILQSLSTFIEGKAAATFVVLAGAGMSLMVRKAFKAGNHDRIREIKRLITKRALFLLIFGMLFLLIWPADILHYYGIYLLIGALLLTKENKYLVLIAMVTIISYPLLYMLIEYEQGWDLETLTYQNLWTLKGFVLNMLYNGFHPVLPWIAFMVYGIWLGRIDLKNKTTSKKVMGWSLLGFFTVHFISLAGRHYYDGNELATTLLSTSAMPPLPLYMLNGMAIATLIISASVFVSERIKNYPLMQLLALTGQYAFSIYVAHATIGIVIPLWMVSMMENAFPITFTFIYADIFLFCSIWFVYAWGSRFKRGPLELFMRKTTG